MKFSSIMRYVLYETNTEKVLLDREIEYLKSYIELQKLRIRQSDFVSLEIEGETGEIMVAPMLLIPFVENAFKHGSKNHQPGIMIRLYAESRLIRFGVINYIKKSQPLQEKQDSGLGLVNIRRRLELIYPGKHNLEIIQSDDRFQANLFIFLQ
jgi:LytS/YehU family sensor histidine kinase